MSTTAAGITILDTPTCLGLLRTSEVGRLAVSIKEYPDIFPINYVVDRGTVVFRSAEGTKLAAALLGRGVAFEVDGYDPDAGEAWSVACRTEAPVRAHRAGRDHGAPIPGRRSRRVGRGPSRRPSRLTGMSA